MVYPNPSKDIFIITNNTTFKNYTLTVYDIYGRVIIKEKVNSIKYSLDMSQFVSGVYFINASSNNRIIYNGKLLKQ